MTYCCDNVRKAYNLILNARGTLDWSNSFGDGDVLGAIFTLGISSNIKQSEDLSEARSRMRRARDNLNDARDLINSCSCNNYSQLNSRYNDLFRENERHKGEIRDLRNERTREQISNTQTTTRLEQQLIAANNNNNGLTKQLEESKNELGLVRVEKDNQLKRIGETLVNLQLEHEREKTLKDTEINKKDSELNEREKELRRKEEEIKKLRSQKGQSKEELLIERISQRKRNLDIISSRVGANSEQVYSLLKYHENLFISRKNRNQVDIDLREKNIVKVKQEFSQQGIDIIDVQEILEKCEIIAELNWELTQLQTQQYQAQQEQPTN